LTEDTRATDFGLGWFRVGLMEPWTITHVGILRAPASKSCARKHPNYAQVFQIMQTF